MMAADILIPCIPMVILPHPEVLESMNKQDKTGKRTHAYSPAKVTKRTGEGAQ